MSSTVHEMRNALAIAVANIEAFIDGKLEPTSDRLGAVLRALQKLEVLIRDVRPVDAEADADPGENHVRDSEPGRAER